MIDCKNVFLFLYLDKNVKNKENTNTLVESDGIYNHNVNENIVTDMFNADFSDWILNESTIHLFALHGCGNQKPSHCLASKHVYAYCTVRYRSPDVF